MVAAAGAAGVAGADGAVGDRDTTLLQPGVPAGYFGVLVSDDHGGFALSDEVKRLYTERTHELVPDEDDPDTRRNVVLVNIVQGLGQRRASVGDREWVNIAYVPLGYEHAFRILEYDGMESVDVDPETRAMDCIQRVLDSEDATARPLIALETIRHLFAQRYTVNPPLCYAWERVWKNGDVYKRPAAV